MRYYFVAGERSGDLHAGNLIKALKQHDTALNAQGFGGEQMQSAGMNLVVHYNELAFMGFNAVVANLGKISSLIRKCKQDILAFRPDVIILVDYAGFNMRIAQFAKKNGIRVFYYISPKVWAWNTSRAWKLKENVDRMFCILPFEKNFYKKFDWTVYYVGNPVLDAIKAFIPDPSFLEKNNVSKDKKIIALLPGSRKVELVRMVSVMAEVAALNSDYQFVVAAVKTLPEELYNPLKKLANIRFVYDSTYDLLTNAHAALVTSGTATLETALFKVPQAVLYKASVIEEKVVRFMIQVRFISLVNLIADDRVVQEFIQNDMTAKNLHAEIDQLLNNDDYRTKVLSGYDRIFSLLDTGSASENAASLMVQFLQEENKI